MPPSLDNLRAVRIRQIEGLIRENGAVSVAELARQFEKTQMTIRRDLLLIEDKGLARRTHGGAVAIEAEDFKLSPYRLREKEQASAKLSIARKAVEFIRDGDSLILNAGTTMQALARELRRFRNLKVVTNGTTVVVELAEVGGAQVIMIGGEVDLTKLGTVGPMADDHLQNIHVAKAFLAVAGISAGRSVAMHTHGHACLNKRFIDAADEITILIDSTRFESHALFPIAPVNRVHRIVTDAAAPPAICEAIRRQGVEVVIADPA